MTAALADLDVVELAGLLQERAVSSVEVALASFERIEDRDGAVGAWARTYPDWALTQARAADARLSKAAVHRDGDAPVLCGVPLGLKDVIAVAGIPLTLGSPAFADHIAREHAAAWQKLCAQGMVLLGHTRSQEFASGNAPQEVANPWDLKRSPGGSSNGSAAAVADRTAPVALGTDVGGSLRRPASACGLTTILATAGRVSTRGILSFNHRYDHVGPLARSAAECALLLGALTDVRAVAADGDARLRGCRIGVLEGGVADVLAPDVATVFANFLDDLRTLGVGLVGMAAPRRPATEARPNPEQVAFHRRYFPSKGHRYTPHGRAEAAALLRQAEVPPTPTPAACDVARRAYVATWTAIFHDHALDAIALPAQTVGTPLLESDGEGGDLDRFGDTEVRFMWNVLGLPVVCVPAGLSEATGTPVGMQLAGPEGREDALLRMAIAYQHATDHHRRAPLRVVAA